MVFERSVRSCVGGYELWVELQFEGTHIILLVYSCFFNCHFFLIIFKLYNLRILTNFLIWIMAWRRAMYQNVRGLDYVIDLFCDVWHGNLCFFRMTSFIDSRSENQNLLTISLLYYRLLNLNLIFWKWPFGFFFDEI